MTQLKHPYLMAIVVLLIGAVFIYVTQPKRGDCDVYVENFRKQVQSEIYGEKRGSVFFPPLLLKALENCRLGNTAGACLRVRELTMQILDVLDRFPDSCLKSLTQEEVLPAVFKQVLQLWIEIAWGESPPERGNFCGDGCWFDVSDIALFCRWKNKAIYLFGWETLKGWEPFLLSNLLYDRAIWENDQCVNCDQRRRAIDVVGIDDVKTRSLLGLNCQRF
ncbi:MAG: hypothetical protein NZ480_05750 [Bdellovibrionaceae bacterium]|nr:hypothetical protein [Pseudobdellovibrionaceae bacterium]MDW8190492.1 hypothetical protein [Pseudobdellovibrionaceae bacterium]